MEGRIDTKQMQRALKKAPERLRARLIPQFARAGRELDRTMQTERLRGRPGLRRRTGGLSQSFHHIVIGKQSLNTLRMRYFTNKKYAAIHEHGGAVRPKRAKYLTIPLKANLTPAGVMRRPIRQFPHVAFVMSRRKALIALAGDSKGEMRPMFVLKKRVKIPKRLGLVKRWNALQPKFLDRLNVAAARALGDAGF